MNGNNHSAATAEPDGASYQFKLAGGNPNGNPTGAATAVAEPLNVHVGEELQPEPQPLGIPGSSTWNSDNIRAQVEQNNAGLRERVLTRLEHMDPQKLAVSVGAVLAKLGYAADSAPRTVDGELEFTGTLTVGGAITSRLAVHAQPIRKQTAGFIPIG